MRKLIVSFMLMFTITAFAEENKLIVKIDGMTCPLCAASVESQFEKLDAVNSVDISLGKGTAIITLKEGKSLKEEDVKNAVKDAGFKAIEVSGAKTN